MAHNSLARLGQLTPGSPAASTSQGASKSTDASPAFRALLDGLQSRADALGARPVGALDAKELAGAVEDARGSLDAALSLGESLIEAYAQARYQAQQPEG